MIYDWQERTAMLVGEEMLERFRNSTVAVIGVGGVGGYAAEMIVRAGVGHLIILDSDDVSVTNKNRLLLALIRQSASLSAMSWRPGLKTSTQNWIL